MATAAEPRPAELPLPGGREGATVKLTPLISGTAAIAPGFLEAEQGRLGALKNVGVGVKRSRFVRVPVPAFLVEHPAAGRILVDTGFHPSVAVEPRQNLGRVGAWIFKDIEMEPSQAVSAQLRERGIDPAEVGLVIMTHLHNDHASAMSEVPEATFLFSDEEWRVATEPRPWLRGYGRRQFDHAFDYRTVDFDGPATESFATFGRSFDVLGDGSVRIVATPGHTPGHMSVVLRLREREALLTGDAAFTERTVRETIVPGFLEDEHLFRRSLREIQLYARETPDALVIPGHDPETYAKLEPTYE